MLLAPRCTTASSMTTRGSIIRRPQQPQPAMMEDTSNRSHTAPPAAAVITITPEMLTGFGTVPPRLNCHCHNKFLSQLMTRTSSARANKGTWQSTKYLNECWLGCCAYYDNKVYDLLFQQYEHLVYLASLSMIESYGSDRCSVLVLGLIGVFKDTVVDPNNGLVYIWINGGNVRIYERRPRHHNQYRNAQRLQQCIFPLACVPISGQFRGGIFHTSDYTTIMKPPEPLSPNTLSSRAP
jgi:hypothetical protein